MPALQPGSHVGAYEILRLIGAGSMGEVYRALDTKLKREVAIKALPEEFSRDPDRAARFQREAEVLASLNHVNIASIYELEESSGSQFLILELVEGETLSERTARGPLPLDEALRIALQICDAVEAAHERSIVHRDLKPANIKLTADGNVKLLDFGLARLFERETVGLSKHSSDPTRMTMDGVVVLGTASYMSPEQARGKTADKRTDIWAFGCVLFEMLTGRQAFAGATFSDIVAAILTSMPDMDAIPRGVPQKIRDLIRKCIVKDPRFRLHDIADARIEIAETINAKPEIVPAERPTKTRKATWLALALLVSALSFVAGLGIQRLRTERPVNWSGSQVVGGSTVAWGPRVSPDGQTVAFIVLIDAQTQVALMDAESGSWDVLTKRQESGVRMHASWSQDGSKVYFTRGTTQGVNVYSIPAVGGEERLALDNAYFPEPLADGSLLVTRSVGDGGPQLYRFWPERGETEPLPVFLSSALDPLVPVRAFADGRAAVFFGRTMAAAGVDAQPGLHIIDLLSKQTRRLDSNLGVNADLWPVSVDTDDFVLSDSPAGDLHRVTKVGRNGGGSPRVLFALTGRFSGLDAGKDGTIFVDQQKNTLEVLRINPSGGSALRVARADTYLLRSPTVERPDGRVILPSLVSGRPRLMLMKTNTLPTPFVDTSEETSGPIGAVGNDNVACLIGSGSTKSIAIASLSDRRILRKISVPNAASIVQLASSPDGATLYYVSENTVWEVSSAGGDPRKIATANSMAVDPNGREIILQRIGPGLAVRLFRMSLSGGGEEEIRINDDVRVGDVPLAANAVGRDGKILMTTALDANTWYWQISVLEPKTGAARHVPTDFAGDLLYAGWTSDGQILAMGLNTEGSIWRFRPETR